MKSKLQKMAGEPQNKQVSTGPLNNRTPLNTIQKNMFKHNFPKQMLMKYQEDTCKHKSHVLDSRPFVIRN